MQVDILLDINCVCVIFYDLMLVVSWGGMDIVVVGREVDIGVCVEC